jgi:hypothetical protein
MELYFTPKVNTLQLNTVDNSWNTRITSTESLIQLLIATLKTRPTDSQASTNASVPYAFSALTDYSSHNCHFHSNVFVTFVSLLRGTLVDIVALPREYNNDAPPNCCTGVVLLHCCNSANATTKETSNM